MDVLDVVGVLAGFVIVVTAFIWSVHALNEHALQKYDYKPVTMVNALLLAPAWVLFIWMLAAERADNKIVAGVLAAAVTPFIGYYIARFTSLKIALAALGMLSITSAFVIFIVAALFSAAFGQRREERA